MTKEEVKKLYSELEKRWYDRKSTTDQDLNLIARAREFILEAMLEVNKKT